MHGPASVCVCVCSSVCGVCTDMDPQLCRRIKAASVWELGQWVTFAFPSQQRHPVVEVWILHLDVLLETDSLMPCWSTCKPASNLAGSPSPHIPVPHPHDVFTKVPFHQAQSESCVYIILTFISRSPSPEFTDICSYCTSLPYFLRNHARGICRQVFADVSNFTVNYTRTCNDDKHRAAGIMQEHRWCTTESKRLAVMLPVWVRNIWTPDVLLLDCSAKDNVFVRDDIFLAVAEAVVAHSAHHFGPDWFASSWGGWILMTLQILQHHHEAEEVCGSEWNWVYC